MLANGVSFDSIHPHQYGSNSDLPHDTISINSSEVAGVGLQWNPSKYQEHQRLQVEVNQQFNLTSNTSLSQPTKTANRKHQINSLAFQAAKTQLTLLENKASKTKTKNDTRSKYGW